MLLLSFHYLASSYVVESFPNKGMIDGKELSNIGFTKTNKDNGAILTAK